MKGKMIEKIEIEKNIKGFMSWFGHDYREREIQIEITKQLEKYCEIFPKSHAFAYLISFDEDESLYRNPTPHFRANSYIFRVTRATYFCSSAATFPDSSAMVFC